MSREPTPVHRAISAVPTSITVIAGAAGGGPQGEPVEIGSTADFDEAYGGGGGELRSAVDGFFTAGGRRAIVLAVPRPEDLQDALAALDDVDLFNLLCLAVPAGAALRRAAAQRARALRALLVLDPEPAWRERPPATLDDFVDGMAVENCALYHPRGAGGVALSAAVAGTIARLDDRRGVARAPAGKDARLLGVDALAAAVGEREAERLNALGINVLRTVPGVDGPVIWGARTLAGAGEWKYVNVRRTALFIEASIERGLQWVVFEPNDEPLWATVRGSVADFLTSLWRDGTLVGSRPRDAFFVRCDRSTMTQDDIDDGRLVALVGIAAVRPAEFVILRFGLRTAPSADDGDP